MRIEIREAGPDDIEQCGRVIYEAFTHVDERHGFPRDFESVSEAIGLARPLIDHPSIFAVVAEVAGRIVGCNFLDERDAIRSVGPTTIDPTAQGEGIGRRLMEAVLERSQGAAGLRLTQDAYNLVSLALYASLGFEVKEPLVFVHGRPTGRPIDGVDVRAARMEDLDGCRSLCESVLGLERTTELEDAIKATTALVAVRDAQIAAYTSRFTLFGHAVAKSEEDIRALVLGASAALGERIAFIVPIRWSSVFRWCLSERMRLVKPMTLMAIGEYREPAAPWFPSAMY